MKECQYFTEYGESEWNAHLQLYVTTGECHERATLALVGGGGAANIKPPIVTCETHAQRIAERNPELGSVKERFIKIAEELVRDP
jgi:hypothetical protein